MSIIQSVLRFVRELLRQAPGDTEYGVGYVDALRVVESHILDEMWDRGIDDEDEDSYEDD